MRQTLKAKVEGTKCTRGVRKSEKAARIADYAIEIEALDLAIETLKRTIEVPA
jgi:hypothetical protein